MGQVRNIIVIGASAGGFPIINKLLAGFSGKEDAAFIAVVHMSRKSNSGIIANTFQKNTALKCTVASDGMEIKKGHLYLALPDHHLMLKDSTLRINQGPHENKYRPSIDVLFRSAAVEYGHRTIGVILTGMLEDGTSGMWAIKRSGGICIVQDPAEAQFSDMPRSVLNKIVVDYQASIDEIPGIINELINKPLPAEKAIPAELQIEADITEKMMSDINQLKKIADHSDFICPDCGGGLWAVKNDPLHRYRCHTGHVYTEKLLQELQDENIEESIWVAIRILEEKLNLLLLMARRESEVGEIEIAASHQKRVNEMTKHISRLKAFLVRFTEDLYKEEPPMDYL
jgi:two-component system chemotaxis response regulator CheB